MTCWPAGIIGPSPMPSMPRKIASGTNEVVTPHKIVPIDQSDAPTPYAIFGPKRSANGPANRIAIVNTQLNAESSVPMSAGV